MVRINFYYKDGCWLCDMAEEMLNGFKAQYEIDVNPLSGKTLIFETSLLEIL